MTLDWSLYEDFSQAEFACHCCGACEMQPEFMGALQALRDALGFAMPVSSGYRCPAHNCAVSSTGEDGPHTTGLAADIAIAGADAWHW